MTSRRQPRALPIVISITIIFSLFPASWLGWTADLADLVRVPVTPISHIGVMIRGWLRPTLELSDLPTDEQERNDLAITERAHFRQMYHAQFLRAGELANQLRDLQSLPESALRNPLPPILLSLDVTGNRSDSPSQVVELKLESGVSGRVFVGDIAVVGEDIVGRISRIGLTRIELLPTSNQETGLMKAAIVPSTPKSGRAALLSSALVRSDGAGALYTEVPARSGIEEGDLVLLDDPAWPTTGTGLILGVVTRVEQLDKAPLRHAVSIRPRRSVRDVARVVVLSSSEEESQ